MRVIEPVGRLSSVPPSQRSLASAGSACGQTGAFHHMLQSAVSTGRVPQGVLRVWPERIACGKREEG